MACMTEKRLLQMSLICNKKIHFFYYFYISLISKLIVKLFVLDFNLCRPKNIVTPKKFNFRSAGVEPRKKRRSDIG